MAIVAGKFKIEKEIGRGAYATVYSAVLIQPYPPLKIGDYVAIKSISTSRISSAKEKEKLENEINLMKTLNHPNIVRLYGVERLRAYYFLIMEYCNYGDLIHFLHSFNDGNGTGLPEDIIINFMYQIGSGLNYLHSHQIVHRDLKPHNILILKKNNVSTNKNSKESLNDSIDIDNFTLKIADFGFARFLRPSDLAETICGSPVYMAPEIQFGTHYTSSVDMWSLGVIIYELIAGRTPFPNIKSQFELAQELKNRGSQPYCLPVSAQASDELREIIPHLLTIDSEKRMTLNEFLSSSIFKKFKDSKPEFNSEMNTMDENIQVSNENNTSNEFLVDSNDSAFLQKYSSINRDFSFIAADGNLTANDARSLLSKAQDSANLISDTFNLRNQKDNLQNSTDEISTIELSYQLSTKLCCFLLDFLFEYKQLTETSFTTILDAGLISDDIPAKRKYENQALSFVSELSEIAISLKDYIDIINSSSTKDDSDTKISAEQSLFNEGLKLAIEGAQAEKNNLTTTDYLSNYKKSLLLLMPIAYRTISDEFTNFVRDVYLKISNRCDLIEKKEADQDQ